MPEKKKISILGLVATILVTLSVGAMFLPLVSVSMFGATYSVSIFDTVIEAFGSLTEFEAICYVAMAVLTLASLAFAVLSMFKSKLTIGTVASSFTAVACLILPLVINNDLDELFRFLGLGSYAYVALMLGATVVSVIAFCQKPKPVAVVESIEFAPFGAPAAAEPVEEPAMPPFGAPATKQESVTADTISLIPFGESVKAESPATPVAPVDDPGKTVILKSAPEEKPAVPFGAPVRPVAPVAPVAAPVEKPVAPVAPVAAPVEKPVAPAVEKPVVPVEKPVTPVIPVPAEKPVAPVAEKPVAPVAPVVAPVEKPVAPVAPVVAPVEKPVAPATPVAAPIEKPVTPATPVAAPVEKPVAPAVKPETAAMPFSAPVRPKTPVVPGVTPGPAPVTPAPVASPVAPPPPVAPMSGAPDLSSGGYKPAPAARTITCPGCRSTIDAGMRFCPNCGSSTSAPPPRPAPAPVRKPYCPSCRVEMEPGMRFCRYCGSPVHTVAVPGATAGAGRRTVVSSGMSAPVSKGARTAVCPHCGARQLPGMPNCKYCGTRMW